MVYPLRSRLRAPRPWSGGFNPQNARPAALYHDRKRKLADPVSSMTLTEQWTNPATSYTGGSSLDAVTGKATVNMSASDTGIIAEAGASVAGWILYAFNGNLYFQMGDGTNFGNSNWRIELSVPIPVGNSSIVFSAGGVDKFGLLMGKASLYINRALVATSENDAFVQDLVSGGDPGGIGSAKASVAVNRGGWTTAGSGVFSGTINGCLIYANQVTPDLW